MNSKSRWRSTSRFVIKRVLEATKGLTDKEIRKALRDAYPFGMRRYYPYKVWLDEIKVQTGKRRFGNRNKIVPQNQAKLF